MKSRLRLWWGCIADVTQWWPYLAAVITSCWRTCLPSPGTRSTSNWEMALCIIGQTPLTQSTSPPQVEYCTFTYTLHWFLDKLAHGFWSVLAQLEATKMTDVMVLVFLLLVWVLVLSVFFKRWGETLCSWMNYGSCVLNKRMMMLQEKFATWFHISRTSQHTFRIYHIKWKGSTLKRRPRALTLSFVTDAKIRSSFRLYISLVLALVGNVWRMAYDLWLMIYDLQCMTLNL